MGRPSLSEATPSLLGLRSLPECQKAMKDFFDRNKLTLKVKVIQV